MICRTVDWVAASQIWANIATTAGFLAGGVSAWLALLSYRGQLRMQADAHAHDLIRDLLKVNMDAEIGLDSEAETFRLYTLEELVDWVREQQAELARWGWLDGGASRRRRAEELSGWEETIKTHLWRGIRKRVRKHPGCYGAAFVDFVDTHAPND